MTREVEYPRRFGVAVTDSSGYVKELVEKPETFVSNEALVGIYYIADVSALRKSLERLIREDIRTRGEFQLTDALQMMLESGSRFRTAQIRSWLDCGTAESFLRTNAKILSERNPENVAVPGCRIIPPCHIDRTARIRNSVVGPTVSVGPEVVIENSKVADSVISERTILGDSEISHSIFGGDSEVKGFKGTLLLGDHSKVVSGVE